MPTNEEPTKDESVKDQAAEVVESNTEEIEAKDADAIAGGKFGTTNGGD